MSVRLPRVPRDVVKLRGHQAVAYDGLIAFAERTGIWRYPVKASGDLEEMSFLDKVYWLYKSSHPISHPSRGSGLDAFFAHQTPPSFVPDGFTPTASLRLSAAGDLMSHPYVASSPDLYADVADTIFGADVAMANLEGVVSDQRPEFEFDMKSGPPLVIEPAAADVLTGHGPRTFDFLATANNHSLDLGEAGVAATIAALDRRGIAFHGINAREDAADSATILERRGIRLGIVSHTFGLNAHRAPPHRPRIVNRTRLNDRVDRIDLATLERQLGHCDEVGVDFVVAHLHWGMEFELYPRPAQLDVAHRIAELGADAIIGHHPHVIQPVEYYQTRRDPLRVVPIFYSLGNLTNPFSAPYLCRSAIARMELAKGARRDGTIATYVHEARVDDVEQHVTGDRTIALRPLHGAG